MKYKCLVLDHDDTIVNSTATVNFPAFQNTLKQLRPEKQLTLQEFFSYSFEPGFASLCSDILGLSEAEMEIQINNWLNYVREHVPDTFDGLREILWQFHNAGGHICVVSHSMKENILRDYRVHKFPTPELIYGWDIPPEQRKPSVWSIKQIMKELHLQPSEMVIVDDLKPGKVMAENSGVDFIAAGWAHSVPYIIETMKNECNSYCETVDEFGKILFR